MKVKPLLLLLSLLTGCAGSPPAEVVQKPRLAALRTELNALDHAPLEQITLLSLRDNYQRLLQDVDDPQLRQNISVRLADLEMMLAEEQIAQAPQLTQALDNAIAGYHQLLTQHPQNQHSAESLYQLAKAYELRGEADNSFTTLQQLVDEFPTSAYLAEVHFRRGEYLYARGQYPAAATAYQQVLAQGDNSNYYLIAAYMLGWAQFKQENYPAALDSFNDLLRQRLPDTLVQGELDVSAQLAALSSGDQRIVEDSLRIMALLFSYQQGPESLRAYFRAAPAQHDVLLYQRLGQLYLNEQRYAEAASVFAGFVAEHPSHSQAPLFFVRQIDTYLIGGFPSLVLPAKQAFVGQYGINGPYWATLDLSSRQIISPYLQQYLDQLARHYHSQARAIQAAKATPQDNSQPNAVALFLQAAQWYQEYVQTFPQTELAEENAFLMAEALLEGGKWQEAITAFESYAYQLTLNPRSAEAGYAALLIYQQQAASQQRSATGQQLSAWQQQWLDSQMAFIQHFANDPRVPDVLYELTQQLYQQQQYSAAIQRATDLLLLVKSLPTERWLSLHQIRANSQFELQQYVLAEQDYLRLRERLPPNDTRLTQIDERLAASIYRQGETARQAGRFDEAIEHFLRVVGLAPQSQIRVTAQFDAAQLQLSQQQWTQAAALLTDFRQRFTSHALTQGIDEQIIYAYQEAGQWRAAALELEQVWLANQNNEQGRQALWVAAEYFAKDGDSDKALSLTRTYAHKFPQPFDEAIEAMFRMSEFYQASNEPAKRRYWLNKLIQAHGQAGVKATERSRWLAAMSASQFAEDASYAFRQIALTLPLDKALTKKTRAFEIAQSKWQQTDSYHVEQFSTLATGQMAALYAQMGADLMTSQRPTNLSELELEEYEFLLEEQALPFEDEAIKLHEINVQRCWQGLYNEAISNSFSALKQLLPGRYDKNEIIQEIDNALY